MLENAFRVGVPEPLATSPPGSLGVPCPSQVSRAQKTEGTPSPTGGEGEGHPPLGVKNESARLSPEEKHEGLEEGPEVVVLRDLEVVLIAVLFLHVDANVTKHLGDRRAMTRGGRAPQGLQGNPAQCPRLPLRTGLPTPLCLRAVALLGWLWEHWGDQHAPASR